MNNDPFKSIIENAEIGYHSPIEVILQRMQTKIEEDCMEAVQRYGFNINKEELEKALRYDRDQYRKGYEAARIQYARPKGEWVKPVDPVCYMCSVCGESTNQEIPGRFFSYCPKCGAKMEGGVV